MNKSKINGLNIFWFKRDLRLHDHAPLQLWEENCQKNIKSNIGIYVLESDYWKTNKASEDQKRFVLGCAMGLKNKIESLGGQFLIVDSHSADKAVEEIQKYAQIRSIICHRETGNKWTFDRDIRVKNLARTIGADFQEIPQDCFLRGKSQTREALANFSQRYYQYVTGPQFRVPTVLSSEGLAPLISKLSPHLLSAQNPHSNRGEIQDGGEDLGIENLLSFLDFRCLGSRDENDRLIGPGYRKEMGSPLGAKNCCSRVSPHLAWGSLSARATYQTASKALHSLGINDRKSKHIQSFITRLAWRSHFMQKFESLHWMEFKCINRQSESLHSWDEDAFEAWRNGMTGFPFVDACMRSLNQTKWLNFRARAMVVSFASYALNLDWRGFGPHLAQNFLDYEPGIHYSQLQMQGGTTLGSPPRIYNPLKQSIEKDPTGEFIKLWVPELRDCPQSLIHLPSDYPRNGYPPSVVDHSRLWSIMRANAPKSPKSRNLNITKRNSQERASVGIDINNDAQLELPLELANNPKLRPLNFSLAG
jgi:deoxyribodipyrimidine photo-lyase